MFANKKISPARVVILFIVVIILICMFGYLLLMGRYYLSDACDYSQKINDNYKYCEIDKNGKNIIYIGPKQQLKGYVFSGRVDAYLSENPNIFVATRPIDTTYNKNGSSTEVVKKICEFWKIDTIKDEVIKLNENPKPNELFCYPHSL